MQSFKCIETLFRLLLNMAHIQYSLLFTQQSEYYSYALTKCSNWSIFKQVYSFRIHFEAAHSKLKLLL